MRHSKEEKAKSRERILDVAAKQIRTQGLDGPSVAEIMNAAGMTHGGFYKHFDSRDDLIRAAVQKAMRDPNQAMLDVISGSADPLAAFVDWYVSPEHVTNDGRGCGVATLGGEIGHSDQQLRTECRAQVEQYLEILERLFGTRERATVALATLVGAITLARAVDKQALAEEILRDVRAALKSARD